MAKQKGTYRIKGKHNGIAYYSVKHGIGDVFRTINSEMSDRVKTAPEYANTRAYAAEFGVATGMSKEIFNTLRYCGANVTNQTYASALCSRLLKFVHGDSEHKIGQRTLNDMIWQGVTRSYLNRLTKNSIDGKYFSDLTIKCYKETPVLGGGIDYSITSDRIVADIKSLDDLGVTALRVSFFACYFGAKHYDPSSGQYIDSDSNFAEITSSDLPHSAWSARYNISEHKLGDRVLTEDKNSMTCFLVVITPLRQSGNETIPLTSLNAFKVIPIVESRIPI